MNNTIVMEPGRVYALPLDIVHPDPNQPRKDFDAIELAELSADISVRGVQQPITVRPHPEAEGNYLIVYGERRFRASLMTDRVTIPALLADSGAEDPLTRQLDQVKENHLRKELNAMEWAELLSTMHTEHKLSDTQIAETLRANNVATMGRGYISNLRRLMNLPPWAIQMIREGKLSGTHGKHLLQALPSETVMRALEEQLAVMDPEEIPNVRDLQDMMVDEFKAVGLPLQGWSAGFGEVAFNTKECKKCEFHALVGEGVQFCLNKPCFADKQNAAKAAQEPQETEEANGERTGPTKVKVLKGNRVDLDAENIYEGNDYEYLHGTSFDKVACAKCEHNHLAQSGDEWVETCFNIPCHDEKMRAREAQRSREKELLHETAEWMRVRLHALVVQDDMLQLALMGYLALGCPSGGHLRFPTLGDAAKRLNELRTQAELIDLKSCLTRGVMGHLAQIASAAIHAMYEDELRTLAEHVGLTINDYRVSKAYLARLDREELLTLLRDANLIGALASAGDCKDEDELRALCLESADDIGVPANARALWTVTESREAEAA